VIIVFLVTELDPCAIDHWDSSLELGLRWVGLGIAHCIAIFLAGKTIKLV